MTSIILVHTFAPAAGEHYTALPNEEGQPVSYVRRVLVEGTAAQALDLAGGFLREGEAVANTYGLPGAGQAESAKSAEDLTEINDALAKRRSKSKA